MQCDLHWLSIDPGVKYFGWALWRGSALEECGLTYVGDDRRTASQWVRIYNVPVVIEGQKLFKGRANGKAVLGLVRMTEALENAAPVSERIDPDRWKGQVPKKVMHHRILGCLTAPERAIYDRAVQFFCGLDKTGKHRNRPLTLDSQYDLSHAAGVGLHRLGRLPK